jgi:hypothetical protein
MFSGQSLIKSAAIERFVERMLSKKIPDTSRRDLAGCANEGALPPLPAICVLKRPGATKEQVTG